MIPLSDNLFQPQCEGFWLVLLYFVLACLVVVSWKSAIFWRNKQCIRGRGDLEERRKAKVWSGLLYERRINFNNKKKWNYIISPYSSIQPPSAFFASTLPIPHSNWQPLYYGLYLLYVHTNIQNYHLLSLLLFVSRLTILHGSSLGEANSSLPSSH